MRMRSSVSFSAGSPRLIIALISPANVTAPVPVVPDSQHGKMGERCANVGVGGGRTLDVVVEDADLKREGGGEREREQKGVSETREVRQR
eukprot:3135935-Rhodomonas_salina.2